MAAINAHDLFYLYRTPRGDVAALRGLNVEVGDAETVSVLGPSGAGKSTLLALCAGAHRPSSGELSVLGVAMEAASARTIDALRRTAIGLVHQHFYRALPRELTVEEIVSLPSRLLGRFGPPEQRRVTRLLQQAALGGRAGARPHELSGGEQQRVAICAALAKQPRLLLADEPTGELDADTTLTVIRLLLDLAKECGTAALIVTHDPNIANQTDRTIHIRDGRLSAEGASDPVLILDRQGWLRLPRRLREQAGFSERVRASATWGRVELVADDLGQEKPRLGRQDDNPVRQTSEQGGSADAVRLEGVTKTYDSVSDASVIGEFSCALPHAKLHVLAGPSGSGKTTILNLIGRLERPTSGKVWVRGERVDQLSPDAAAYWRRRTTGYLSQHSTLVSYMTARENVELGLALRGFEAADVASLAEQWLDWVGLGALVERKADHLSGGEQRRVALARALAPTPYLLIADEPTAHLDRTSGMMVIRLLHRAVEELSTTVVAASHDPDVIAQADSLTNLGAPGNGQLTAGENSGLPTHQ